MRSCSPRWSNKVASRSSSNGSQCSMPAHAPAFGQRLVERILSRRRAELLAIAGAEALDAVGIEQRFRGRHQGERLGLVGRALVGGIEAAQAVDFIAEEIEPERLLLAGREQVDERPAHRIFAMLGDRIAALIAEARSAARSSASRSIRSPCAMRRVNWRMRNGRQHPLRRRAGGGHQQLRLARASPAAH